MQEVLKITKNFDVNLNNISGNTALLPNFFLKSVGQSDKPQCPTVKPLQYKGKTVGRHKKNLHEAEPPKKKLTNKRKNAEQLRQEVKSRQLQLEIFVNLIKRLTPKIKIVDKYWFTKYHQAIRTELSEQDYLLLKKLIRTFAILNSQHRTQNEADSYEVSEQDYLFAFRLLKWKNNPLKSKIKPEYINFLDLVEWYFYDEPFTSKEVKEKLRLSSINKAREIIKYYIQENKIKKLKANRYQLTNNNFFY